MRPSRLAVLGATTAAVALTGGLLTGVPGACGRAAADGHRRRATRSTCTSGRTAPQTCTVVYDLYRPSTRDQPTPAPAILTTNGFGGSKDDQADLGQAFAERGYVVLSYSGLGFGGSDCKISLDDPDYDGKAAQQLVSFLGGGSAANDGSRIDYVRARRTAHDGEAMAHDPRVGMIGGSYGGQVQFAVAGIDPRVDAIVPIITWNDLSYSLAPNNTDIPTRRHGVSYDDAGRREGRLDQPVLRRRASPTASQYAATDPTRNVGCPNFVDHACVGEGADGRARLPDRRHTIAFARHASVSSYVDRIRIPTLLVQGENDTLFNLQEAAATYRALQAQGTETKMIWQSWGHSGGTPAPGELDMRHPEQSYEGQRVIAWFEHYLKDKAVDTGPEFSYFRDWVGYTGIATPAYGTSRRLPGRRPPSDCYLSGADDARDAARPPVRPAARRYANLAGEAPLSYSEVSALQGDPVPNDVTAPYDTPGSFAAWTHRAAGRAGGVGRRAAADRCSSRRRWPSRPRRPARPGSCCCSPRSTTWLRTAPRPWSTGSSRRPGSPT